jgi:hypothetical protein
MLTKEINNKALKIVIKSMETVRSMELHKTST